MRGDDAENADPSVKPPIVSDEEQGLETEKGQSGAITDGPDAIELALAAALDRASAAGQWEVVGKLASELSARRRELAAVHDLPIVAAKRSK